MILFEKCSDKIDMDKNDIKSLDFNKYKNQKHYIYYSIIKDKKIDNATLRIIFLL